MRLFPTCSVLLAPSDLSGHFVCAPIEELGGLVYFWGCRALAFREGVKDA